MDKLDMHSPDFTDENIKKLADLFPNCVTESADEKGNVKRSIDFDLLRQELSNNIVEGPRERYHLNWPGKREALLTANAPIAKTLRPCRKESVDFDTTENLFIEGDNLDALKLLQETYLGKVKMIYIDPPYNTGKDFIYKDDFKQSAEEYLLDSEQYDDEGNRLVANMDSNGRFHSDWLSMMYSRLKLARNLLTDDGVIFISIDENEFQNLLKLCSETFGEENYIGAITWKNCTDNNPTNIAIEHEYILVFARYKESIEKEWKSPISDIKQILVDKYTELVESIKDIKILKKEYNKWFKEHKVELWPLDGYKNIDFNGIFAGIRGVHNPGKDGYRYDVKHPKTGKPCKQPLMGYRFPRATMDKLLEEKKIIFGEDETKIIEIKSYIQEYNEKLSSVLDLDNRSGAYDVRKLFLDSKSLFQNPKPIKLLTRFISLLTKDHDHILDFFAGSSATAHAVMQLNAEDGGNRKFIMVQLPEVCDEKSEAFKAGYQTIAEISKERIRRAGKKIKEENDVPELDTGFRVLKVDSSNMVDVYYTPDSITQDELFQSTENIKDDRTSEDLLFQVLLDWGVDLTLPITKEWISDREVFFVDDNALAACFVKDGLVTEEFCKELAQRKPLRVVFRDSGFKDDSAKINVEQIFKLLSPHTEVKTI